MPTVADQEPKTDEKLTPSQALHYYKKTYREEVERYAETGQSEEQMRQSVDKTKALGFAERIKANPAVQAAMRKSAAARRNGDIVEAKIREAHSEDKVKFFRDEMPKGDHLIVDIEHDKDGKITGGKYVEITAEERAALNKADADTSKANHTFLEQIADKAYNDTNIKSPAVFDAVVERLQTERDAMSRQPAKEKEGEKVDPDKLEVPKVPDEKGAKRDR